MKVGFQFECDDEEVKGIDNIVININRGSATVKSITYQTTSAPATSDNKPISIPKVSNSATQAPSATSGAVPKITIPTAGTASKNEDGVY